MDNHSYQKYFVKEPTRQFGKGITGRQTPVMTYMSDQQVPGCGKYVEMSWIMDTPSPNPHTREHVSKYDKLVMYVGADVDQFETLGAEIDYYLGGQRLTFDKTAAIYIPKGVPHGPAVWRSVSRPHLEIILVLGPEDTSLTWNVGDSAEFSPPTKKDDIDYSVYLVTEPAILQGTEVTDAIESPAKIYMSSDLVPESQVYIDFGWIPGIPPVNPPIPEHDHGYEEIVIMAGIDPEKPKELGAEMEFSFDNVPIGFNTTTAIYVPKDQIHGPLSWKTFERPHLLMPIVIGTGNIAEAAPAGYSES